MARRPTVVGECWRARLLDRQVQAQAQQLTATADGILVSEVRGLFAPARTRPAWQRTERFRPYLRRDDFPNEAAQWRENTLICASCLEP